MKSKEIELIARSIPFQALDLADSAKLSELKVSPKFIVHAAGFAAPWGSKKQFYLNNVIATKNLLDFAWKKNVKRFVFISSSSVYSSLNDQFNVREDHIPVQIYQSLWSFKIPRGTSGNGCFKERVTRYYSSTQGSYREGRYQFVTSSRRGTPATQIAES